MHLYTGHSAEFHSSHLDLYLMDNMELLRQTPDHYFDLAIVDPPYGIGWGQYRRVKKDANGKRYNGSAFKTSDWDKAVPPPEYFQELFRVSKNQIIWGGNYFDLPTHQCFIFWYKQNPIEKYADGELAWTSFERAAKCFDFRSFGNIQGDGEGESRIHPSQKPVKLYEWCLHHFAKEGDKILDTHLGSGSHAIAAHHKNFHLTACEIDEKYWHPTIKRIKEETIQLEMNFPHA